MTALKPTRKRAFQLLLATLSVLAVVRLLPALTLPWEGESRRVARTVSQEIHFSQGGHIVLRSQNRTKVTQESLERPEKGMMKAHASQEFRLEQRPEMRTYFTEASVVEQAQKKAYASQESAFERPQTKAHVSQEGSVERPQAKAHVSQEGAVERLQTTAHVSQEGAVERPQTKAHALSTSQERRIERPVTNTNVSRGTIEQAVVERQNISLKGEIINHLYYAYPINYDRACWRRIVRTMIPVNSAVTNFERRAAFRKTEQYEYASKKENQARLLFFVGLPSPKLENASLFQQQLDHESKEYGDIIQINVTDTYFNLTLKVLGVLNWVATHCPNSEVVLKIDDDTTILPPYLLLPIYRLRLDYTDFVVGQSRVGVKPDRNGKCKISKNEYPDQFLPPFALGYAVGYPVSTAILLYEQALRTKLLRLDDAFLTGICRELLGVPLLHDDNFKVEDLHKEMEAENFVLN